MNDIKVVYGDQLGDAEERYARLIATFEEQYGGKPDLLARSPGRVNLIGEHIDYEGFSVLPMALALDTIVAVKVDVGSDKLIGSVSVEAAVRKWVESVEVDAAALMFLTELCKKQLSVATLDALDEASCTASGAKLAFDAWVRRR